MSTSSTLEPSIQTYLARVEQGLAPLSRRVRKELLTELGSHFADAIAAGSSTEAAIARMGDPADVARDLLAQRLEQNSRALHTPGLVLMMLRAGLVPFVVSFAFLVGGLFAVNYVHNLGATGQVPGLASYVYQVFGDREPWQIDWPWMVGFALWVSVIFVGLKGWPRLARRLPRQRVQSLATRLWMTAGSLGLALLVALLFTHTHLFFPRTLAENAQAIAAAHQEVDQVRAQKQTSAERREAAQDRSGLTRAERVAVSHLANIESDCFNQAMLAASTFGSALLGLAFGYGRARGIPTKLLAIAGVGTSMVLIGTFSLYLFALVSSSQLGQPLVGVTGWMGLLVLAGVTLANFGWAMVPAGRPDADI